MVQPGDKISEIYNFYEEYLSEFDDRPQQGTPEWIRERQNTIGGSEIASLFDVGYNTREQLRRLKLGASSFSGNVYTMFGNLFEDVLCEYVEYKYNCRIIGTTASLLGRVTPRQSFSPDGIAVVSKDGQPTPILFEFKCPYSRIPKGIPPPEYVMQVKLGLGTIPQLSHGILIEAIIRRCAALDMDFSPKYNTNDNPRTGKNIPPVFKSALAYGFIGFYVHVDDAEYFSLSTGRTDFGSCSKTEYQRVIKMYGDKLAKAYISDLSMRCPSNRKQKIVDVAPLIEDFYHRYNNDEYVTIGILPWKLLTITETTIMPDPEFYSLATEKVDEFFETLHDSDKLTAEDLAEIEALYE